MKVPVRPSTVQPVRSSKLSYAARRSSITISTLVDLSESVDSEIAGVASEALTLAATAADLELDDEPV